MGIKVARGCQRRAEEKRERDATRAVSTSNTARPAQGYMYQRQRVRIVVRLGR